MKYLLIILVLFGLLGCDNTPTQLSKRFVLESTETVDEDVVVDIYADNKNNTTCYVYRFNKVHKSAVDYSTMSCVKNEMAPAQ